MGEREGAGTRVGGGPPCQGGGGAGASRGRAGAQGCRETGYDAGPSCASRRNAPVVPDESAVLYYGLAYFLRAVEAEQRPLHEAAEEQMMQNRKKCRKCREEGHKPRGYMCNYSCHEHWQPEEPDARALALIEERLRDEYAGEAASAALKSKAADDRREEQQRADEKEAAACEQLVKDVIR